MGRESSIRDSPPGRLGIGIRRGKYDSKPLKKLFSDTRKVVDFRGAMWYDIFINNGKGSRNMDNGQEEENALEWDALRKSIKIDGVDEYTLGEARRISDYIDTFPEDMCEDRTSWDELYDFCMKLKDGFDALLDSHVRLQRKEAQAMK